MVKKISTEDEFNEVIKKATGLVVFDWFAEWCGPCKQIAPFVENLSKENPDVAFYKIDVDELEDLAAKEGIQSMPSFHFYKGGNKVDNTTGANKENLAAMVAKHK
eukprot:NODE_10701_length_497_cov_43.224599_g10050_i0.p1 GENE.NODE_10701_length_497_cov_43.224599_g10050_i0~~NODE_10701_length_497_cov_43.224599_g10050_i0.p1  ORF type:complete len:105 (-),score=18.99 NODE_10701_length_497_cov_43.224599_g10050_i0:124-438(-)